MRRRLLLFALVLAGLASPASAATLQHFSLGAFDASPNQMITGPDGAIWIAAEDAGVARLQADGRATLYRAAAGRYGDVSSITTGSDGNLWFIDWIGDHLGRMTPTGTLTLNKHLASGELMAIAAGPDRLWLVDDGNGRIGRVTLDGAVTWFPHMSVLEDDEYRPGVIDGPGGSLWIAISDKLLRIDPQTGRRTFTAKLPTDDDGLDCLHSTAQAQDGSWWIGGCRSFLHLLPDGSSTVLPLPRELGDRTFTVLPAGDGRLYASDGTAVLTLDASGKVIARAYDEFGFDSLPLELALASDGALWLGDWSGGLMRMPVSEADAVRSPYSPVLLAREAGRFYGVTVDPAGATWLISVHGLLRIAPDGSRQTIQPDGRRALGTIAAGGDRVWFTTQRSVGYVRDLKPHVVARLSRSAYCISAADDGTAWLVDARHSRLGRVGPSGRLRWFRHGLARVRDLLGVATDLRGGAWFVAQSGWLGHVSAAGRVRLWRRPGDANPVAVAVASDGAVWFTEVDGARVVRRAPGGHMHVYDLRVVENFGPTPLGIAAGRDGAMWVTTLSGQFEDAGGVARVSAKGVVTTYPLRDVPSGAPFGLATAPDGSLLFTLHQGPVALARFDPWADPTLGPTLAPREARCSSSQASVRDHASRALRSW